MNNIQFRLILYEKEEWGIKPPHTYLYLNFFGCYDRIDSTRWILRNYDLKIAINELLINEQKEVRIKDNTSVRAGSMQRQFIAVILTPSTLSRISLPAAANKTLRILVAVAVCRLATM